MPLRDILSDGFQRHVRVPAKTVSRLPMKFMIEPTNFCNLKCPICYTHAHGEGEVSMTLAQFTHIADQLPPGADVSFYNWGEPFLNPEMIPMIREGARRGLRISIHSNLNIDPALIPEIVESGLFSLSASIDGTTQESYEKFRRKGSFRMAWDNLSELARINAEHGFPLAELGWQFIVNRYNEHEVERARELCASLPGKVVFTAKTMGLRREKVEWDQFDEDTFGQLKAQWLPRAPQYLRRSHQKPMGADGLIADSRCEWLWDSMVINVNGRVTPCCHTYKPEHAFGDLGTHSLEEIWNSTPYVTSREQFLDTAFSGCNTVCARCPNYVRMDVPTLPARLFSFLKWLLTRSSARLHRRPSGRGAEPVRIRNI